MMASSSSLLPSDAGFTEKEQEQEEILGELQPPEEWSFVKADVHNELLKRYYRFHLKGFFGEISRQNALLDISEVIVEYASDGYCVGMYLDVRDRQPRWCVTRVVDMDVDESRNYKIGSLKVHYCGWPEKYDEWIPFGHWSLSSAFSQTMDCWLHHSELKDSLRADARQTMQDKIAWIEEEGFSEKEAKDTLARFDNDQFTAVNLLMFTKYYGPNWIFFTIQDSVESREE
jgi:hypothetical protein